MAPTPVPRLLSRDGGLWVFDKPSGLSIHRTNEPDQPDLVSWAQEHFGEPDLAPCHRLDRATSGLVLLAADARLRAQVGEWLASGKIDKTYVALVHGRPANDGTIDRDLFDRRRRKPLSAVTRFTHRAVFAGCTLLDVHPETGRKHQIRRHLQALKHPVVGDTRYGPRRPRHVIGAPERLWLHLERLALPDGRTLQAPLAPELQQHLDVLAQRETDVAPQRRISEL